MSSFRLCAFCATAICCLIISACGPEGAEEPGDSPAVASGALRADTGGRSPANEPPESGGQPQASVVTPLDEGTIAVTLGGVGGTVDFADVNAHVEEQPMNGRTRTTLFVEAHKVPPGRHLNLDLYRENASITPGRYTIEPGSGKELTASWEDNGSFFRSIDTAHGYVELKSISDDRASGQFELTLVPLQGGRAQHLTGKFDVKVQPRQ